MVRNWFHCEPAAAIVLALSLAFVLAGCGSSNKIGPPPVDTVTYPTASTQGWLQQIGTGYVSTGRASHNGDTAYGEAVDPSGNVVVLDQTYGAFPGFTNNGSAEFAVVKFDGSGNRLWTQQLGTGSGDYPNAIAIDAMGNILLGGSTYGAFSGFTNSGGVEQCVVMQLNSSGQTNWIQQFPSTTPCQVMSLAVDATGNVVVGSESLTILSNGTAQNAIISKLAGTNGATLWTQQYSGTPNWNYAVTGVAVDKQSNVIAVGNFPATSSSNSTAYMVVKMDGGTGQTTWQQQPVRLNLSGGQPLSYTQVALDAQGDIFVGGADSTSGYNRCAVAELANSTGSQQWQQEFGAAETCIPGNLATDTTGDVLMTGNMFSPFFASSKPSSLNDVFLAKLGNAGHGLWLQQFGTGYDIAKNATYTAALMFVTTDSQNHAYVAGTTTGAFPNFTNPNNLNYLFVTQFAP